MSCRYAFLLTAVFLLAPEVQGAERAGAPALQPSNLIALLQSDAPKAEKVKAMKPLAIYGDKTAVPALAAYLADDELASWARIALEAIPDPACDEALLGALPKLKGRLLVGAINSIGVRRDAKAVDTLSMYQSDADVDVATAAAAALGRIGNNKAAEALRPALEIAVPAVRSEVADALVRCSEKMLAAGRNDEAAAICDLVAKADVPEHRVLEAVRGAILARGPAGLPALVDLLKSADPRRFAFGLKMTREVSATEVTEALIREVAQSSPARQAVLLTALADRAEPKAREFLFATAAQGQGPARIAAVAGLKKVGDRSCLPVLFDTVLADDADVSKLAQSILGEMPLKEIDDMLMARLPSSSGKGRLVLIDLIGGRGIAAATPILVKLADDTDSATRVVTITALGGTASAKEVPLLIARAVAQGGSDEGKAAQRAIESACRRTSDREALSVLLVDAMATATPEVKCGLIKSLVTLGGPKALEAVAVAARDVNPEIRRAAYQAFGEWTTADVAPVLAELVKSGDPRLKTGALRAYIRVARQFNIAAGPRMAMFREIMSLADRDEERQLALDILLRINTTESLATAVEYLDQPAIARSAEVVVVRIADGLVKAKPKEVIPALERVIKQSRDNNVVHRARFVLSRAEAK